MNTERDEFFSPEDGTQLAAEAMSWLLDPEFGFWLDRLEIQRKIELGIYDQGPEEF